MSTQNHLAENLEILKKFVLQCCVRYDLSVEENRESMVEWIQFFRAFDVAFAKKLANILEKSEVKQ